MNYPGSRQIFLGGDISTSTPQPPPTTQTSPYKRPITAAVTKAVGACCDASWFVFVTLLLVLDLVSDGFVVVVYALRDDVLFVGVSVVVFVIGGFAITVFYAVHMRTSDPKRVRSKLALCLVCNFPFQLGVLCHRVAFLCGLCGGSDPQRDAPLDDMTLSSSAAARRKRPVAMSRANTEWVLMKLKVAHSLIQSAPQLVLNIAHMLTTANPHPVQYVSAGLSFASLLVGVVRYERRRKERLRRCVLGPLTAACVGVYKLGMLTARVLAFAAFAYRYGPWIGAVILPHLTAVFIYLAVTYGRVWKVDIAKIGVHAVGSVFDYVAVHNEYRPDGEIAAYYVLLLLQNLAMVTLAYRHAGVGTSLPRHSPWMLAVVVAVVVGSVVGLVFMFVYYFALHRSRKTIRERISCRCCCCCCCCCRSIGEASLPETFPPRVRIKLYADSASVGGSVKSSLASPNVDGGYFEESGPPSYVTNPNGVATPRPVTDSDVSLPRHGVDEVDVTKPLYPPEERAPRPRMRDDSNEDPESVFGEEDREAGKRYERKPLNRVS